MAAITTTAGTLGAGALFALVSAAITGESVSDNLEKIWDKTKNGFKKAWNELTETNGKPTSFRNSLETGKEIASKINDQNSKEPNKKPNIGGTIGATTALSEKLNQNDITDTTGQNTDLSIGNLFDEYIKAMQDMQKAEWERADKIRKETQEREDTAWQRAIRDINASGANANLLNVSPAASGGGIIATQNTQASAYTEKLKTITDYIQQQIENNFKGDENEKDRFMKGIATLVSLSLLLGR